MEYRALGQTGWKVSAISFGAWAIGGSWGRVDDAESLRALHRAVEMGTNFFDTADVYGDGHSEQLLRSLRADHGDQIRIATKVGRRLNPHVAEGYTPENLTAFVDRSLRNLGMEPLDLVQLHCPPFQTYYMPEVFEALDRLVADGKIRHYGISVEKVEEAIKAIEYPNVRTVQIIFNLFRMRPMELFFDLARRRGVGILARVPLASGLLTGKLTADTAFEPDDHRVFNRHGEHFDRGETFSGVPLDVGLRAVEALREVCPEGMSLAQFALRWILMFDEVSCAIPGAKRSEQVEENAAAADLPPLSDAILSRAREIYDRHVRALVHPYW